MSSRPDPFDQMEAMFDQMRRAAFDGWDGRTRWNGRTTPALQAGPTSDVGITVDETDDGYVVMADLPGFGRDEIDLTFGDGVLTVSADHEVDGDETYRQRTVRESVRIPAAVDVDAATASYRNGVLEVSLPADVGDDGGHRIEIEE